MGAPGRGAQNRGGGGTRGASPASATSRAAVRAPTPGRPKTGWAADEGRDPTFELGGPLTESPGLREEGAGGRGGRLDRGELAAGHELDGRSSVPRQEHDEMGMKAVASPSLRGDDLLPGVDEEAGVLGPFLAH